MWNMLKKIRPIIASCTFLPKTLRFRKLPQTNWVQKTNFISIWIKIVRYSKYFTKDASIFGKVEWVYLRMNLTAFLTGVFHVRSQRADTYILVKEGSKLANMEKTLESELGERREDVESIPCLQDPFQYEPVLVRNMLGNKHWHIWTVSVAKYCKRLASSYKVSGSNPDHYQ